MKPKGMKKKKKVQGAAKRQAAARAIVGQLLVHFGAGYGRAAQIFAAPKDSRTFSERLFKSTLKHLDRIDWEDNVPNTDAVCSAAHAHGKKAHAAARGKLTWKVIERTLRQTKTERCPGKPKDGAGLTCA